MFRTAIAGSLPKPSWLAEPEKLWPEWKASGPALDQAKADATASSRASISCTASSPASKGSTSSTR
jgi:hypothetical protein